MKLKKLSTFIKRAGMFDGMSVPGAPEDNPGLPDGPGAPEGKKYKKLVPNIKTRKDKKDTQQQRKEELVDIYFNSQPNLKLLMDTRDPNMPVFEILQQALLDMLNESGFAETPYGQKLTTRVKETELFYIGRGGGQDSDFDEMKSANNLLKQFHNVMMILGGYSEAPSRRHSELISDLLKLADRLDQKGLINEANMIDKIFRSGGIKTIASVEEYIKGLAKKNGIQENEAMDLVMNELNEEKLKSDRPDLGTE